MDPNRLEAERCVTIAMNLLTSRDLIGSKTFAIRARESVPNLEIADQILAVAETLISGEVRINNQPDYYAILRLVRFTHELDLVATQYRRFGLILHPQKNRLPFADQAFRLVSDAWTVLSNPSKKELYDNELSLHDSAGLVRKQQPFWKTPPPPPPKVVEPEPEPEEIIEPELEPEEVDEPVPVGGFWTACPYCFNLYEYSRVYQECVLRCQNCRRAFQAVTIPDPPLVGGDSEKKDDYFCCWGYFPLGFSESDFVKEKEKEKLGVHKWTPFSPIFSCPTPPQNGNVGGAPYVNRNVSGPKTGNVSGPKTGYVKKSQSGVVRPKAVIIDDDEIMADASEPSEDSDFEWGSTRKKKTAKKGKGKSPASKNAASKNAKKAAQAEKVKRGNNQNVMEQVFGTEFDNFQGGPEMQDGDLGVVKKVVGSSSNSRRQMGKHGNDMGKLDLNVEFSNEVEEHAHGPIAGNRAGNGEEDNIEGIGFFEGLDEFLSSLPILSVVGGDKGKAAH